MRRSREAFPKLKLLSGHLKRAQIINGETLKALRSWFNRTRPTPSGIFLVSSSGLCLAGHQRVAAFQRNSLQNPGLCFDRPMAEAIWFMDDFDFLR
ncbi:MAG: hypothetical protein ACRC12_00890 [Holosporales bacterium]